MRLKIGQKFVLLLMLTIIAVAIAGQAAAFIDDRRPSSVYKSLTWGEKGPVKQNQRIKPSVEPVKNKPAEKPALVKVEPEKTNSTEEKEINPWLYWFSGLLVISSIIVIFIYLLKKLELKFSRTSSVLLIIISVVFFMAIMVINRLAGKGVLNNVTVEMPVKSFRNDPSPRQTIAVTAEARKIKSNEPEKQSVKMGLRPTQ